MMNEFTTKNVFSTDEQDLNFFDDLFDDELFGSSIQEELDYETKKLLEDY